MPASPHASSPHLTWSRGEFQISTDPSLIDLSVVHGFLTNCYWAKGIPLETLRRSLQHSICFGVYKGGQQAGFARVITDRATFAYLADVFVLDEFRRRGLSKWLMRCIAAHPDLQGLRRWCLVTRDAHGMYSQFGFTPLSAPERWMEMHDPEIYARNATKTVPEE